MAVLYDARVRDALVAQVARAAAERGMDAERRRRRRVSYWWLRLLAFVFIAAYPFFIATGISSQDTPPVEAAVALATMLSLMAVLHHLGLNLLLTGPVAFSYLPVGSELAFAYGMRYERAFNGILMAATAVALGGNAWCHPSPGAWAMAVLWTAAQTVLAASIGRGFSVVCAPVFQRWKRIIDHPQRYPTVVVVLAIMLMLALVMYGCGLWVAGLDCIDPDREHQVHRMGEIALALTTPAGWLQAAWYGAGEGWWAGVLAPVAVVATAPWVLAAGRKALRRSFTLRWATGDAVPKAKLRGVEAAAAVQPEIDHRAEVPDDDPPEVVAAVATASPGASATHDGGNVSAWASAAVAGTEVRAKAEAAWTAAMAGFDARVARNLGWPLWWQQRLLSQRQVALAAGLGLSGPRWGKVWLLCAILLAMAAVMAATPPSPFIAVLVAMVGVATAGRLFPAKHGSLASGRARVGFVVVGLGIGAALFGLQLHPEAFLPLWVLFALFLLLLPISSKPGVALSAAFKPMSAPEVIALTLWLGALRGLFSLPLVVAGSLLAAVGFVRLPDTPPAVASPWFLLGMFALLICLLPFFTVLDWRAGTSLRRGGRSLLLTAATFATMVALAWRFVVATDGTTLAATAAALLLLGVCTLLRHLHQRRHGVLDLMLIRMDVRAACAVLVVLLGLPVAAFALWWALAWGDLRSARTAAHAAGMAVTVAELVPAPVADADNAALRYQQAYARLSKGYHPGASAGMLDARLVPLASMAIDVASSATKAAALAMLEGPECGPAWTEVAVGARLPRCVFPMDRTHSQPRTPQLELLRHLTQLGALRVRLLADAGHMAAAVAGLGDLLAMGRQSCADQLLVMQVSGLGRERRLLEVLRVLVADPRSVGVDFAACRAALLTDAERRAALVRGFDDESVWVDRSDGEAISANPAAWFCLHPYGMQQEGTYLRILLAYREHVSAGDLTWAADPPWWGMDIWSMAAEQLPKIMRQLCRNERLADGAVTALALAAGETPARRRGVTVRRVADGGWVVELAPTDGSAQTRRMLAAWVVPPRR